MTKDSMMPALWLALLLAADPEPVRREWKVDGLAREALLVRPSTETAGKLPVVFGFHGHGGNMHNAMRTFQLERHWPEALVVYMQGIPTPGRLTDPEGKRNGWQHNPGEQDDRDLKFFDAVLATLKKEFPVDLRRIYATGHSNGGGFTYVLWRARADVFAAFAPSASASRNVLQLTPKPAMHIAGENDPLVKFAGQSLTMQAIRRINGCEAEGQAWAKNCTLYKSPGGTPFVAYIHSGDHKYPAEAPPLIVRFFKEHAQPAAEATSCANPVETTN
jgi:polyhydroxybutyrate depolymerase